MLTRDAGRVCVVEVLDDVFNNSLCNCNRVFATSNGIVMVSLKLAASAPHNHFEKIALGVSLVGMLSCRRVCFSHAQSSALACLREVCF